MLALVLFILFGLFFGYFATLNTALVSVNFGTTSVQNAPLYIIILAALATGVLFATLFYSLKSFGGWFERGKKEKELKEAKEEAVILTKKVHQLELAMAKLKGETEQEDEESL